MNKAIRLLLLFSFITSCKMPKKTTMKQEKHHYTNQLIDQSSPYLLQHAHNPVNWHPWGKKAIDEAKQSNKLIIISIGYAACHWCHVMEHESFEDTITAQLMNKYYVPIKVDREEHPDVDKIYMSAVQQLTGRGGWPLNIVALPDGRPVWGGTYFKNNQWKTALDQIAEMWQKNPQKLYDIANQLEKGIKANELIAVNTNLQDFNKTDISNALLFWKKHKDSKYGGFQRAPKFPIPAQYRFLLRAGEQLNDIEIKEFVKLTLDKMAQGGIYDHINGGFARYATDVKWHIPHFEKMLYDNAQLVSLYSDAYLIYHDETYKQIIYETLQFVQNELTDETGAFYASLDADSLNKEGELEEGAYYVFTKKALKELLGNDFDLFTTYYNINSYGLWEEGKYHLIKNMTDDEFVKEHNINKKDLRSYVQKWRRILHNYRNGRPRPRLDDKTLTSWNALMLQGYIDAYKTFRNERFLKTALDNAQFLEKYQIKKDYSLWHAYKNGTNSIEGLLEDYAFLIQAYISLYEVTGDEKWLTIAEKLNQYTLKHFYNSNNGMFYFTHQNNKDLLTRPVETDDNVTPSSNAIMSENLFKLGHFLEKSDYIDISTKMIHNILPKTKQYAPSYYQWLHNELNLLSDFYEVAIVGKNAQLKAQQLFKFYLPNKIIAFSKTESTLPLLKNRYVANATYVYLCVDNTCQLPVEEISKIIDTIQF